VSFEVEKAREVAGKEFQAAGPAAVNALSASFVAVPTTATFPRRCRYGTFLSVR